MYGFTVLITNFRKLGLCTIAHTVVRYTVRLIYDSCSVSGNLGWDRNWEIPETKICYADSP